MDTIFLPKEIFLTTQPNIAGDLQKHRMDSWLLVAFAFALSEMAHNGASAEQIAGARNFIHTMQNLWEAEKEVNRLPTQRLETYDGPLTPPVPPETKK